MIYCRAQQFTRWRKGEWLQLLFLMCNNCAKIGPPPDLTPQQESGSDCNYADVYKLLTVLHYKCLKLASLFVLGGFEMIMETPGRSRES